MKVHILLLEGMQKTSVSCVARQWAWERLGDVVGEDKMLWNVDRYGKPYLSSHGGCFFNLAHSGGMVVLAIDEADVGVDVEFCRPRDYEGLARRFFHPLERDWIGEDREKRFYQVWTAKEAYLKAVGIGLRTRLAGFSVVDANGYLTSPGKGWELFSLDLSLVKAGYMGCICGRGTKPSKMMLWEGETFSFVDEMELAEAGVVMEEKRDR